MAPRDLITTYLQMTRPADFRPRPVATEPPPQIMQMGVPHVGFYRFLYAAVGAQWAWRDRDAWPDDHLRAWLAGEAVRVFVLYVRGTPAGYIELDAQPDATEIAYLGLLPDFLGQGYGSHLLSYGVQQAWDAGAPRVWVHTCNLDSPGALPTYQRIGFTVYDEQREPLPAKYT